MSILLRNHNSDPGREKTPRPIRERFIKINALVTSTMRAVEYERNHALNGDSEKMFRSPYAKWITGKEVVAPGHAVTRVAKAAPVVAESIDKMEVTAKPSGQIDLDGDHLTDPDMWDAMANDENYEVKPDTAKIGVQDMPDETPDPNTEEGGKVIRMAEARKQVDAARTQEAA